MAEEDDHKFLECSGDKEVRRDKPSDDPATDKAAVVTAAADGEAKKTAAEGDGKCGLNCFSSALMVSGAVVAAVAVGLFVTKKLKEK